jgi:hypothetical protein
LKSWWLKTFANLNNIGIRCFDFVHRMQIHPFSILRNPNPIFAYYSFVVNFNVVIGVDGSNIRHSITRQGGGNCIGMLY